MHGPSIFSRVFFWIGLACAFAGCGKSEKSCDDDEGRKAIAEAVNEHLNSGDCAMAIAEIDPYWNKEGCTTQEIRLARASAYACALGVNFFGLISNLADGDLSASGFWATFNALFPSSSGDSRPTAGNQALDALFSIQNAGVINRPQYTINASTPNPGSLVASHRTSDSNIYGLLTSIGMMGVLQNQYGAPNATNHKITKKLGASGNGWEAVATMTDDGCAYAGSVLTFVDSVNQVAALLASSFGSSVAQSLLSITGGLNLDAACKAGCDGTSGSGCSAACTTCPIELRARTGCKTGAAATTDDLTCAAAGIVKAVNLANGY